MPNNVQSKKYQKFYQGIGYRATKGCHMELVITPLEENDFLNCAFQRFFFCFFVVVVALVKKRKAFYFFLLENYLYVSSDLKLAEEQITHEVHEI